MAAFDVRPMGSGRFGFRHWRVVATLATVAVALTFAACGSTPVAHSGSPVTAHGHTSTTTTTTTTAPSSGATAAPALAGGATPVTAPTGPTVSPPPSVVANCSVDVSKPLRKWLKSLPAGQTVVAPANACYLVNEGLKLDDPKSLTIYGATFMDKEIAPGRRAHSKGSPVISVVGGSGLTLEALHIVGANAGGYHPSLAFEGGIELEGTAGATIRGVTISNTYGDGITLAPLRGGADHASGTILAPASSVVIRDVTISEIGRQGITFASISGAQVSDVIVNHPGINTFDFEADQSNEGARDVTINGCESSGGTFFFANGGASDGQHTGNITVDHCTMEAEEGGSAILVARAAHNKAPRGPFMFNDDSLHCGASDYVSCVQVTGGDVTVSSSTLEFPTSGTVHEPVYHAAAGSQVTFDGDVVTGYGRPGTKSGNRAAVQVVGGQWSPWSGASP
jgi:hypothetical protein